jgi:hypothetical protein
LLLVVLVFLHLSFWPVAYHNKRRKYTFFIFLNPKTVDPTTSVHNNPYQTTIYYMYLLHCVNSSTLARLRTTKLKKLYIYIYTPNFFDIHIHIHIYVNVRHSETCKNENTTCLICFKRQLPAKWILFSKRG